MECPRDWNLVTKQLLKHCQRPAFAERAEYCIFRLSRREKAVLEIRGLSIRFAEQAMLAIRNLMPEVLVLHDDDEHRVLESVLTDLESNVTHRTQIVIRKAVETTYVTDGVPIIGEKKVDGRRVAFLVAATNQEVLAQSTAQVSRALRTHIMRLIPADVLDACRDAIAEAVNQSMRTPAGRNRLLAMFSEIGVTAKGLEQWLGGRGIDSASPEELRDMVRLATAIAEGYMTWREALSVALNRTKTKHPDTDRRRRQKKPPQSTKPSAPTKKEAK